MHPRFYELLLQALKEEGADIAGCDVKKVCKTEKIEEKEQQPIQRTVYSGREATANLYDAQMYLKSVVAWNKLYKKNYLKRYGFPKESFMKMNLLLINFCIRVSLSYI